MLNLCYVKQTIIMKRCKIFCQINIVDIDECRTNNFDCDKNATCENNAGSYDCKCNAGYSGDGKTCRGVNTIQLTF